MWYHVLEVYDLNVLHSKKLVQRSDQEIKNNFERARER